MKDIIGYVAAVLTTFSMLPQILRILRLKEARDVSIAMPLMIAAGGTLWVVYGIILGEAPIIAANAVSLIISLATVFFAIKYR